METVGVFSKHGNAVNIVESVLLNLRLINFFDFQTTKMIAEIIQMKKDVVSRLSQLILSNLIN